MQGSGSLACSNYTGFTSIQTSDQMLRCADPVLSPNASNTGKGPGLGLRALSWWTPIDDTYLLARLNIDKGNGYGRDPVKSS
jgi:hypothetical protein